MSREIKFRAKTLAQDTWCYGSYFKHIKRQVSPLGDSLEEKDIEHVMIRSSFADWNMPRRIEAILVNPNTVGQYTGIRDKNGKEIYEGDIVRTDEKEKLSKVEWDEDNAGLMLIADSIMMDFSCYYPEELEVVGNIYENPELL
ncbi:MAG: YopX family protein [Clostridium sp.]